MGSLEPGKNIVYEKDDKGVVWGRYHGESERWQVGGTVERSYFLDYAEWRDMTEMAENNPNLKSLIDKALNTYRLMK